MKTSCCMIRTILSVVGAVVFSVQTAWAISEGDCDSVAVATGDSIALGELVVQATMQRTDACVSTYIPNRQQKNGAQNASQLLHSMAIPQLAVDPRSESVKTVTGSDVKIFINMVPATQEDLQGLRMSDVRKVEYMEFPSDPRFKNAPSVVNIVMATYEWGGYTKISPKFSGGGFVSYAAQVYSRFAVGKVLFDVSVRGGESYTEHMGRETVTTYRLPDYLGQGPVTFTSVEKPLDSKYLYLRENVSFKMIYSTEKTQLVSYIVGEFEQNPKNRITETVDFDTPLLRSGVSLNDESQKANIVGWKTDLFQVLPRQWSISVSPYLAYSRTDAYKRDYYVDDQLIVKNPTIEDSWKCDAEVAVQKNFMERHSVTATCKAGYESNAVDYYGTSPSHMTYRSTDVIANLKYQFSSRRWFVTGMAEWLNRFIDINHADKSTVSIPSCYVYASFSPDDRHSVSANVSYSNEQPVSSMLNPTLTQLDQIYWSEGNPSLGRQRTALASLNYVWLPSNKWQFDFFGMFKRNFNRWGVVYTPEGPEGSILARRVNDGESDTWLLHVGGTLKLLNGSLILNATPQLRYYDISSDGRDGLLWFNCTASASYYFGQFYVQGIYYSPNKGMSFRDGTIEKSITNYELCVGWGNSKWNVSLRAFNFAKWDYIDTRSVLHTRYYDRVSLTSSGDYHAGVFVSASYTFGYGKKVTKENEGVGAISTSSALDFGK